MADAKGFTQAQVDALVAKLRAVDLTGEERALLQTIFQAAAGSEDAAGFMLYVDTKVSSPIVISSKADPSKGPVMPYRGQGKVY